MTKLGFAAAVAFFPSILLADSTTVCTFPTLPSVIVTYAQSSESVPTLRVGGRPAVSAMARDLLSQTETVLVDDYTFEFSLTSSRLTASKDGNEIHSERGQCVSLDAPSVSSPIDLVEPRVPPLPIPRETPAPTETVPPPASPRDTGRWQVKEDVSAFDDSKSVFMSVNSTTMITGQFGPSGPATLQVRCMENSTSVFIWMNDNFLADIQGYGRVEFRIDDRSADAVSMEVSTDNKALGLWSGGRAIPFIQSLFGGETIVFRVTPFNESPIEFSVPIGGLEQAIQPLREACGW